MAQANDPPASAPKAAQTREDRLKAALKANLARRKAQTRLRAQGTGADSKDPETPGQERGD